jgi:hypothetical protein
MRKSDLRKNHDAFDAALSRYRGFMDRIINAQRVISSAQEKRDIAESVVLRICAHWESFIDEHLIDCANRDHSKLSEYFGVNNPANPNKGLCHALIFSGGYKDFKSFGDLKGFSKKLLPDESNPFLAVTTAHAKKLDEVYKIRNYLSHYSATATRALHRMYKEDHDLERFVEPGKFLLSDSARRLWVYFDAFAGASAAMKSWCSAPAP